MKRLIKINFVDFWDGFDSSNNDFINELRKTFDVELSHQPDYIFFSCFGYEHLKYKCIRIFYTGEAYTPNFNECDYAIGFDRMTFGDRYLRIPLYQLFQYKKEYNQLKSRRIVTNIDLSHKTDFCSFVYSNCFADDIRTKFFKLLSSYKRVNSGGRYLNNIGAPVSDKKEFQSRHKFAIAFENSSYDGYCTEKLMEAFAAGCIPIYHGDPRVTEDFNPDSFINVHEYSSIDDVVNRVKEIDADDALYLKIRNAAPLHKYTSSSALADFLAHIFNQKYDLAFRRPFAIHPTAREEAQLRHVFFESKIYTYIKKIKNFLFRLRTGTIIKN